MNSGFSIEAETQDKEESEEEEKKEAAAGNHSFLWDSKLIGHPSHFLIKGEPFHQGHGFTKSLVLYLTPQIQKTDATLLHDIATSRRIQHNKGLGLPGHFVIKWNVFTGSVERSCFLWCFSKRVHTFWLLSCCVIWVPPMHALRIGCMHAFLTPNVTLVTQATFEIWEKKGKQGRP